MSNPGIMKAVGLAICLLLVSAPAELGAQGSRLSVKECDDWWDGFGDRAVGLTPPRLPDGLSVGHLFADWGITLSNASGPAPISERVWETPLTAPPRRVQAIVNGPSDGGIGGTLVIAFDRPVRLTHLVLAADSFTVGRSGGFGADGHVPRDSPRSHCCLPPRLRRAGRPSPANVSGRNSNSRSARLPLRSVPSRFAWGRPPPTLRKCRPPRLAVPVRFSRHSG